MPREETSQAICLGPQTGRGPEALPGGRACACPADQSARTHIPMGESAEGDDVLAGDLSRLGLRHGTTHSSAVTPLATPSRTGTPGEAQRGSWAAGHEQ